MNRNQDVVRSLQLKAFAKVGPKWGVSREVAEYCWWLLWYYSLWTLLLQNTAVV